MSKFIKLLDSLILTIRKEKVDADLEDIYAVTPKRLNVLIEEEHP